MLQAIDELDAFCHEKTIEDFRADRALQFVVERELEIVGEAMARLQREHPNLADQITDANKIVGLRNVLAYGYDTLEYEILWDVAVNKLTSLKRDIGSLL
ncbi:MAG: HepT-like ribonuclease domain-containing protein [Phycisphaerales bacterium]